MAALTALGQHEKRSNHLNTRNGQACAVLEVARTNRYGVRDFILIGLIFRHGLSVRSLIALRPAHVAEQSLMLCSSTGAWTRSCLHPTIAKALAEGGGCLGSGDDRLFRSQLGGAIKRQTINYIIETTSQKAGVPPFSPTELRHLCGYNMAAAGCAKTEVYKALGLSGKELVKRYFSQ